MKHTNNLNLTLYEPNDIFNVTGDGNSLNNNMKVIDAAVEKLDDNLDHKITKFYASNLGEKSLHDSDNGKIEDLHIYGKSEQQQYSGRNLFDFNAWKDSISSVTNGTAVYGENSIKLTATDNHCDVLGENYITAKPSTTYTLSWNADSNKEGGIMVHMDGEPTLGAEDDNSITKKITFTTNSNTTSIRIEFGVTIAGESITYSNIQLEVGETVTSYEPYVGGVPAPNPNYPQEIKSVGDNGSIEVQTCGKNLFDLSKCNWKTKELNGLSFIRNDNGEILVNGTATAATTVVFTSYGMQGKITSGKLIVTGSPQTGVDGGTCRLQFYYISPTLGSKQLWQSNSNETPVTLPNDYTGWNCAIFINAGFTANNLVFKPMLRFATITDNTFEPYKSKTATITTAFPLCGIPVSNGGNYTDSNGQQWIADELIYNADGTGKIIKNIGKIIFDGSEDWSKSGITEIDRYIFRNASTKKGIRITSGLCNTYIVDTSEIHSTELGKILLYPTYHDQISVNFAEYGTSTVETFKDYLKNNPVVLYTDLIEPQEIELSPEELQVLNNLPTYYPITNVSATSGSLDANMVFNYPISLAEGWNYVKQQLGDTRNYIYNMDLQSAEAYVNSEYAVALMELEV